MRDKAGVFFQEEDEASEPQGKNYLFVIAIDDYKNGISPLRNPVRDAKALVDTLVQHYQNFSKKHCFVLFNEAATRDKFGNTFKRINQQITSEDSLILYFSGHGMLDRDRDEGYWLLHDAKESSVYSFLPNHDVLAWIKRCAARHVYAIVDACFSGTLFRSEGTMQPSNKLFYYTSRYLLTSGREELVDDGAGNHSPFAQTLLNRLRDPSLESIWGVDLARHVLTNIQTFRSAGQLPRGDYLPNTAHDGGEMLFLKKTASLATALEAAQTELSQPKNMSSPTTTAKIPEVVEDNSENYTENIAIDKIREYIVKGRHVAAFKALEKLVPSYNQNTLILLRAQYANLKENENLGLLTTDQLNIEKNKFNYRLLSFLDDLEE